MRPSSTATRRSRLASRHLGSRRQFDRKRRAMQPGALDILEERALMSAVFTPGTYQTPAVNRPDVHLGTFDGVIEPFMAINPTDPGNIAIASNNAMRLTDDAGGTWSNTVFFPKPVGTQASYGDSGLGFDSTGRLFWSTLKGSTPGDGDVAVDEIAPKDGSPPGALAGNTVSRNFVFSDPNNGDDKDLMAADSFPNSPYKNNLYVVWSKDVSGFKVYFSRSSDHGLTWSNPIQLSGAEKGSAWPTDVTVAPNGDVYVAYHLNPSSDGSKAKTIVCRSTNGGASFTQQSTAFLAGQSDPIHQEPDDIIIPGTTFRSVGNLQPWVLADPARPGNVYVVADDDPDNNYNSGDAGDVVFARSTDNGKTWTRSTISSGPPGSFQLFPNAAIDKFGDIIVSWYDNRRGLLNAQGDYKLDVMARYSTDGGQTWSQEIMVSDPGHPIDPDLGNTINNQKIFEYYAIGIYGGTAYFGWCGDPEPDFDYSSSATGRQVYFDAIPIHGKVTINGDDGGVAKNDDIVVQTMANNPDFIEILVNGQRQYAGLAAGLGDGIVIDGKGGNDTLTINLDAASQANITYNITMGLVNRSGAPLISYSNIENLTVLASTNTSTVANVIATHPGTTTVINGAHTVVVGNGNLPDNIKGTVELVNTASKMNVTVDDSADGVFQTATLDSVSLLGWPFGSLTGLSPAPIQYRYHDTASFTILTGTGGPTVNIKATGTFMDFNGNADAPPVSVVGHSSSTINVGKAGTLSEITGTLTLTSPPAGALMTLNVIDSTDAQPHGAVNLDLVSQNGSTFGRINGLAPANILYRTVDTDSVTINTGIGGNTVNVKATLKPVTLVGHGVDTVNVGSAGSVQQVKGALTVTNPPSFTTLNIDDSTDSSPRTVVLDSVSNGTFGRITGLAPGQIKYKYADTAKVTIQTGTGAGTVVNVKATGKPVTLIGHSTETVNVGDAGNVQQVKGALFIQDPPLGAFVTLNVDDSADPINRPAVTHDTVSENGTLFGLIDQLAPAPIEYQYTDTSNVTLQTGTGGAIVNVKATGKPLAVVGHANGAVVNVGKAGSVQQILGDVSVSDPPAGAFATLNINDSADANGRDVFIQKLNATGGTITGLAPAAIKFNAPDMAAVNVTFGGGSDNIAVQAIGAPLSLTTSAGNGQDHFTLGDAANSLDNIKAPVTIHAAPTESLVINDQGTQTGRNYTVNAGSVAWTGGGSVVYTGLGSIALNGSSGDDTFFLKGSTSALTSITAGPGNDTAVGSSASEIWVLNGTNAGRVSGPAFATPLSFGNIENLTSGSVADYYLFADAAKVTGNLNGGGQDTLDYRNYTTSVVVDLQLPSAGVDTGVGGIVTGVNEVLGGAVAPSGPGVYNLLIGNGGNLLFGGAGRRNILVAGASPSTLTGGDDEDLIITGTTAYDTQPGLANWQSIAAYWAGADPFATRALNLRAGNGVPLLDPTTVTGNGGGNNITGNNGKLLLYSNRTQATSGFALVQTVIISP